MSRKRKIHKRKEAHPMVATDSDVIKKTFLISGTQDRRLKLFCHYHRITASQLLRLMIDELKVTEFDLSLRHKIQSDSFKLQDFLGVFDIQEPDKEVLNEGGKKKATWYKKVLPYHRNLYQTGE